MSWVEIDLHDAGGLADIRRSTSVPIASLETLYGLKQFRPFLEARAVDVAIIDVPTRSLMQQTNSPNPTKCRDANFGWSARDACYPYGSFVLDEDEALVITHRPPKCRFWNLVVWNQFMATHGVTDARCSINGHSAALNADGTVTIVISQGVTGHPEFPDHA